MDGEPSYKPLVSVIIPNYNHAAYLNERIDSVLNQTFRDFEVILLDDCSTDNSREIIESYRGHEKISQIEYNEVNSGSTFIQWKKGLDLAQGDWIWIAESDDFNDNSFIEMLSTRFIEENALVFSKSFMINEKNQVIGELPLNEEVAQSFSLNGKDFIKQRMLAVNFIPNASAVIFNRRTYLKSRNKIENLTLSGDYNLWLLMLSIGNISYINTPLNYYRFHQQTVRNRQNNMRCYLKESELNLKILAQIEENHALLMDKWIFQVNKELRTKNIALYDAYQLYRILWRYGGVIQFLKSFISQKK